MNKTSYISIIVTALFVAGVFFWVKMSKIDVPKLGQFQVLSDIGLSKAKIKDSQGKSITLADLKGKLVVLHSWASWCAPCMEEIPQMMDFFHKNQDKKIVLIAIHREPIRQIPTIQGLPIYFDEGNILAQEMMMIKGIPSTLFIAPSGKVQGIILGKAQWQSHQMQERVDLMLKEVQ